MKTSSRIIAQFSLWIAIIVGVLFLFLNLSFFWGWVTGESDALKKHIQLVSEKTIDTQSNPSIMMIPKNNINLSEYNHYATIQRIRHIRWNWRILAEYDSNYYGMNVSQNISGQTGLLWVSFLLRGIVIAASFVLGKIFVRRSLSDLTGLTHKLYNRSTETKQDSLHLNHLPQNDEINEIADAIMWLEDRVQAHYAHLRTFVSHVSHEIKTPLMELWSSVDILTRMGTIDQIPGKVRSYISEVQRMIDGMLMLTTDKNSAAHMDEIVPLHNILLDLIVTFHDVYADKHIHINHAITSPITVLWNTSLLSSLLSNLIDNACKYSEAGWIVNIQADIHTIQIKNTWILDEKTRTHMRDPFWQADKSRSDGFGIWLSLVQQIASLHQRSITYTQKDDHVICSVSRKNLHT
jgi:signal transduction histidine kinase